VSSNTVPEGHAALTHAPPHEMVVPEHRHWQVTMSNTVPPVHALGAHWPPQLVVPLGQAAHWLAQHVRR